MNTKQNVERARVRYRLFNFCAQTTIYTRRMRVANTKIALQYKICWNQIRKITTWFRSEERFLLFTICAIRLFLSFSFSFSRMCACVCVWFLFYFSFIFMCAKYLHVACASVLFMSNINRICSVTMEVLKVRLTLWDYMKCCFCPFYFGLCAVSFFLAIIFSAAPDGGVCVT